MDREEDRGEHGRRQAGVLAREQADEQDGEGDDPHTGEGGGADPPMAARRSPSGRPRYGPVSGDLDRVLGDQTAATRDVARHRQVGGDEHRQRRAEQDQVEVPEGGRHAGGSDGAADSIYSERRHEPSPRRGPRGADRRERDRKARREPIPCCAVMDAGGGASIAPAATATTPGRYIGSVEFERAQLKASCPHRQVTLLPGPEGAANPSVRLTACLSGLLPPSAGAEQPPSRPCRDRERRSPRCPDRPLELAGLELMPCTAASTSASTGGPAGRTGADQLAQRTAAA